MVGKSWLKNPGLKLGVEKSGVKTFFNPHDDIEMK